AGKAARVTEAVKQLSESKLDQSQAVKFARSSGVASKPTAQAAVFKVKSGKATWCDVRRVKNVMRLEFKSESQAEAVQDAIRKALETLAAADATPEDENS